MPIEQLFLHDFRNFENEQVTFAPGVNLLEAGNGQGKTNLLEGIHYSCLAHSQRTRKDKELIRWGRPGFVLRLEGRLNEEGHRQSVEVREDGDKRVKVENRESRRLTDLLGHFRILSLGPDDIDLINGTPQLRRRFLDAYLCQDSPTYIDALRRYNQALKQRNSLLKRLFRPVENQDLELLDLFGEQLIESGTEITMQRMLLLEALRPAAAEAYEAIGQGREKLDLELSCAFTRAREPTGIATDFREKLARSRNQEIEAGTSLVGPHRDDISFAFAGKAVRDFGSQGQKRSVALSLKLAAARLLETRHGYPPILLLDDVFAELDESRRSQLGALIDRRSQVIIANPRKADLPFQVEQIIAIREGRIL